MTAYYPDYFNDVFGPVMQPGSSSHTAGPCRIGNLAHQLLSAPLKNIRIELDKNGSFAGTFGVMQEDLGMLAGAYGLLPDDQRIFDIKEILSKENISYQFAYIDFPCGAHPNAVRFILTDINNTVVALTGNSVGGGRIETEYIKNIPYNYRGDCYLSCFFAATVSKDDFIGKSEVLQIETVNSIDGEAFLLVSSEEPIKSTVLQKLHFNLAPILPVISKKAKKPQLFTTFKEWSYYAETHGITLAEASVRYEEYSSGWNRERIRSYMKNLRELMECQTQSVYENPELLLNSPFAGYHFEKWKTYEENKTPLSGHTIAKALRYTFGVQALSRGVKLVPGPMGTGGGFLYASLRAVSEKLHSSEEQIVDSLFIAAGIGAIAYSRTDPTGEVIGCMGECGVCGAMAAAAVTYLAGGSPKQVEDAASLTMQASLGWPCDPIPGGYNQPCLSRFVTAVTMSIVFSDIALSGRDSVIPFHEVIDTSDKMGREMPQKYKCTSVGGICETAAGKNCRKKFDAWRAAVK